jgi:hypothetical protein
LRHETIMRHVALVSYGTKSLRTEMALDDWYRHGIFWGARLQFRRLADNALLADDFTLWLGILARAGATRLSLHMLAQFALPMPDAMARGDYAIVAHYPDRHEIWAVGEERSEWLTHPLFPTGEHLPFPIFPDAARYAGDLDAYWCVENRPGALQVPDTNWQELAAAIARDLETSIPSSEVQTGPFYGPVPEQCHARMPLFPQPPSGSLAYRIVSSLDRKKGQFDSDMHPHNDNGSYAHATSEAEIDKLYDWGGRLDSWTIEVLIRCANETRSTTLLSNEPPLVRVHTPALEKASYAAQSHRLDQLSSQVLADQAAQPQTQEVSDQPGASVATRPFSWVRAIALLLAAVLLSGMVLVVARLIAGYPWVSAVVGLPLALYLKYRKPRT